MLSLEKISRLYEQTQARWLRYNELRGKSRTSIEFWDIVVLTAIDDVQKEAYELQLQRKFSYGELPVSSSYHVIADPPGPKIGNGGSTLFVINELFNMYHEEVYHKKIIIVHGGGFSQRLPSASILGKVFLGVPIGQPMYHSLDLKLATYVDFPAKIKDGGIFVCSADTFEVYDDGGVSWLFQSTGFTGLAHLSPISIGRTHGVYVLKEPSPCCELLWKTSKFLHKPSIEVMESTDRCVVLKEKGVSWVMTDSAFFISASVSRILLDYYHKNSPLTCEIDAYGDFLQASGEDSTSNYTSNVENVCHEDGSLLHTRKSIYNLLQGTPLHALVLAPEPYFSEKVITESQATSIFYHIGTMPEFIENFTCDEIFRRVFGVQPLTSCHGIPYTLETENSDIVKSSIRTGKIGWLSCKIAEVHHTAPSIMRSIIKPLVSIGSGSIIEYSVIGQGSVIGSDCIISGCCIPDRSTVPKWSFHHTIPVDVNGKKLFITVAFETKADIKRLMTTRTGLHEAHNFGTPLQKFMIFREGEAVSLWTAKMFPAALSMEESYRLTRRSVLRPELFLDVDLYSMSDALKMKDLSSALEHRDLLSLPD